MSKKYIPLYSKYRPMTFADITGQQSTVKALSNSITSGKIMHAYLFCGPRGTGKTSSARIFAKSLNCKDGPTLTPCGKCPGCLDIINSSSIDIIEIDAASNRSVEDARNILEKVQYAPVNGKYKIYIIDEVHMLTTEASNTLLKTLEEPPENVVFILATTESHKVLETIASRCQRYDFKRITTSDIVKRLEFIAKEEKIKIDSAAVTAAAKNAGGGMRDAVALLDQLSVLGQNRTIGIEDVNELLGRISYDTTFELTECILNADCEKALLLLNDIHDKGNEPARILTAMIQYLRDLLIIKCCSDKDLVFSTALVNEESYDKIKSQADKIDSASLIYYVEKISKYFAAIKETVNKYMQAELCIIELTGMPKVLSLAELTEKITFLEARLDSGNITVKTEPVNPVKPAILPKKPEEVTTSPEVVTHEETKSLTREKSASAEISVASSDINNDWKSILEILIKEKPPAGMFFSNLAKPIEVSSKKIELHFSNELALKQATDSGKKNALKSAAMQYYKVSDIETELNIKSGSNSDKKKINLENTFIPPEEETPPEKIVRNSTATAEKKEVKISGQKYNEQILPADEIDDNDESEYITDTAPTPSDHINFIDLPDTAKTIIQLFDGRIAD